MTTFHLEVAADFACFTRPEMKVERVSYDIITPSAVRAVFESILWKPAIRWQPERIEVLAPIRWSSIRRNEIANKISVASVQSAMNKGSGLLGAYIEDERQQRAGLLLRDVRYRLTARLEMTNRAGPDDNLQKFSEMFRRRADKGQCINQPYLGCREFACAFRLATEDAHPIDRTALPDYDQRQLGFGGGRPLGWMLYDMNYQHPDSPCPRFFNPWIENGVVTIPDANSTEVRG